MVTQPAWKNITYDTNTIRLLHFEHIKRLWRAIVWLTPRVTMIAFWWYLPYFIANQLSYYLEIPGQIAHVILYSFAFAVMIWVWDADGSWWVSILILMSRLLILIGAFVSTVFDQMTGGLQEIYTIGNGGASVEFGFDSVSVVLLVLTLVILSICYHAALSVTYLATSYLRYIFIMNFLLIVTFSTTSLFFFFVFFEGLLIPMFLLIGVWGARERKIKAAYYFFLYTLFGSIMLLFVIFYLINIYGTEQFDVMPYYNIPLDQQYLLWALVFVSFAVKIPLFPLHIWLPEAHVEAPTVGSMILASLLLKLGGYGFLRISLTLFKQASTALSSIVSVLASLGVLFGSLSTIRQIDLKRSIAYSSVAHMNFVTLGIFSQIKQGVAGAVYLMLGHGVVSAALFFCVGVVYDRHHSRLIRYYGGLTTVMPVLAIFFLLFTLANMGFPTTSNFPGELILLAGLFSSNTVVLCLAATGVVWSSIYAIWLFNRVMFGTLKTLFIRMFIPTNRREILWVLNPLFFWMVFLGVTSYGLLYLSIFGYLGRLKQIIQNVWEWLNLPENGGYFGVAWSVFFMLMFYAAHAVLLSACIRSLVISFWNYIGPVAGSSNESAVPGQGTVDPKSGPDDGQNDTPIIIVPQPIKTRRPRSPRDKWVDRKKGGTKTITPAVTPTPVVAVSNLPKNAVVTPSPADGVPTVSNKDTFAAFTPIEPTSSSTPPAIICRTQTISPAEAEAERARAQALAEAREREHKSNAAFKSTVSLNFNPANMAGVNMDFNHDRVLWEIEQRRILQARIKQEKIEKEALLGYPSSDEEGEIPQDVLPHLGKNLNSTSSKVVPTRIAVKTRTILDRLQQQSKTKK